MKRKYTISEVLENLNNLDDYERTEDDNEQDAVKIAIFILSKMDKNISFTKEEGIGFKQIN